MQIFVKPQVLEAMQSFSPTNIKWKKKAPEAMPFFGKPQEQPEAMQIFNAENGTGSKHEPEAMPIFEKTQTQPEAMQIFNLEKVK